MGNQIDCLTFLKPFDVYASHSNLSMSSYTVKSVFSFFFLLILCNKTTRVKNFHYFINEKASSFMKNSSRGEERDDSTSR